jgi:hypothetical protein
LEHQHAGRTRIARALRGKARSRYFAGASRSLERGETKLVWAGGNTTEKDDLVGRARILHCT